MGHEHRNDIRVITDRMDRLESRMERLPVEVASRVETALTGVNSTLQNVLLELRGSGGGS